MSDVEAVSSIDQPPPQPNDERPSWELVLEDMEERHRVGVARYGTPLQPFNGRNSLEDAYAEILDLAVYIRNRIEEDRRPHISPLVGLPEIPDMLHLVVARWVPSRGWLSTRRGIVCGRGVETMAPEDVFALEAKLAYRAMQRASEREGLDKAR